MSGLSPGPSAGDEPVVELMQAFAEVMRELAARERRDDVLSEVARIVCASIPGAEHTGVTVRDSRGRYRTVAATSDLPVAVDLIQYETGEGPCLESIEQHHVFRSGDLRLDSRWPAFASRAVEETGVLSVLSRRLFVNDADTLGALNLYSTKPHAFAESSLPLLSVYATHSAILLAGATDREASTQMANAVKSNRSIGMAMGILMARYNITKDEAFDLLRMASQHSHRKLVMVALGVIETGTIEFP